MQAHPSLLVILSNYFEKLLCPADIDIHRFSSLSFTIVDWRSKTPLCELNVSWCHPLIWEYKKGFQSAATRSGVKEYSIKSWQQRCMMSPWHSFGLRSFLMLHFVPQESQMSKDILTPRISSGGLLPRWATFFCSKPSDVIQHSCDTRETACDDALARLMSTLFWSGHFERHYINTTILFCGLILSAQPDNENSCQQYRPTKRDNYIRYND